MRTLLTLLAFSFVLLSCGGEAKVDGRPNLLVLVSDDQGIIAGCYGEPGIQTPHLDALAAGGIRFEQAYAPCGVCTPSRSSLYTGLMPMHNGARGFDPVAPGTKVWGEHFAELGYRTGLIGKLGSKPIDRFPFDFMARTNKTDTNARDRDWNVTQLDAFLAEDDGRPWVLVVNFRDSHWPFPVDGAPFGDTPLPPHDPGAVRVPPALVDAPETRQEIASYYDGLRRMDATVGALEKRLGQQAAAGSEGGQAARPHWTVFTSDNGPPFPLAKTTLYEAGVHMPLIVSGPGVRPGTSDALVGLVDVLPTLADLAGGEIAGLDGRSFAPLLRGEPIDAGGAPWRDQIEMSHDGHRVPPLIPSRAVRFRDFKYIRTYGEGLRFQNNVMRTSVSWRVLENAARAGDQKAAAQVRRFVERPPEELFNLKADPFEMVNLANDPQHSKTLEEGRTRLGRSTWVDVPE